MKKSKILALLLAAVMLFALIAACADDTNVVDDTDPVDPVETPAPEDDEDDDAPPEEVEIEDIPEDFDPFAGGTFANITDQVDVPALDATPTRDNTLIVGYNVAFTGDAIHGFTNASYDWTIRALLGGGTRGNVAVATQVFSPAGDILVNGTVVESVQTQDDDAGNRTYVFTINEGLNWSDGTAITAFDFVATVLFRNSPQWVFEAGAAMDAGHHIDLLGHGSYSAPSEIPDPNWVAPDADDEDEDEDDADDADDEDDAEPETAPMIPNPDRVDYFRGVHMIDDMTFALTIDAENLPYFYELTMVRVAPWPAHVMIPGVEIITDENGSRFSEDIIDHAHNFAQTYRFNPTVVAGPYTFVSFENNIVTLARNPLFPGDANGNVAQIDFIQQIMVSDDTDVDQFFAAELDVLPDQLEADKIERVLANPDFNVHEYLRFGYGVINFQWWDNDHLPVSDVNVRLAFAHVVDRQAVLDAVLGGRGALIDTMASPGQWMWQARGAEAVAQMIPFTLNIERANYYLDQSIWIYEADGTTPFDPEQANAQGTYLRHNSDGEVLHIRNAAANAAIGAAIEIETVSNAAMAGMRFTSEDADWVGVIMPSVSTPWTMDELVFSTFSMGTGFAAIFDPYFSFHSDFVDAAPNPGFSDAILDEAMVRMRLTDPEDHAGFLEGWFDFVIRFNEYLPALPLYNNMWMDFYNPRVVGMSAITDLSTWAEGITALSLAD